MAYANRIGNWRLVILKGNSEDEGAKDILGIKTKLPRLSPVIIWASIIHEAHLTTINRVPLQSPSFGAIFLNNIMEHHTFNSILNGGKPGGFNEFKYSLRYRFVMLQSISSSSDILSAAKYVIVSPRNIFNVAIFIAVTCSFRAQRIVRSVRNVGFIVPGTSS